MPTLLAGKGYFSLSDSDTCIGSLFSIADICEILQINDEDTSSFLLTLENMGLIKNGFIDEKDFYHKWKDLKKMFSTNPPLHHTSFDEYVLFAIFRRTFPDAEIKQQVQFGRKYIDFKITLNGVTKYVEFDGPRHFISEKELEDPFKRIKEIENLTGCELVRWPFWIQRCSQNAKVLFDESLRGYGALWTSTKLFGDFTIANPSKTIKALTKRFYAEDSNGIGYFYEEDKNRHKYAHPIIKKAIKDPKNLKKLIPFDAEDKNYWIPKSLWELDTNP